jgi:hypothetical protein
MAGTRSEVNVRQSRRLELSASLQRNLQDHWKANASKLVSR